MVNSDEKIYKYKLKVPFPKSISAIDVEKAYQLLNNKKDII